MKPRIRLAAAMTPGGRMELIEHDGAYVISLAGQELMHSRSHAVLLLFTHLLIREVCTTKEPKSL